MNDTYQCWKPRQPREPVVLPDVVTAEIWFDEIGTPGGVDSDGRAVVDYALASCLRFYVAKDEQQFSCFAKERFRVTFERITGRGE